MCVVRGRAVWVRWGWDEVVVRVVVNKVEFFVISIKVKQDMLKRGGQKEKRCGDVRG